MEHALGKKYPVNAEDYKLYEEVGEGVSATVYRALCVPLNNIVAIKVLDLEKCNNDLDGIRREVQTMSLIDHPNVLRAHCSFTSGHCLWVVMPYMAGGSCLHIMKTAYPEGFEETIIATLLREVLKALVYLHAHGHIHRDVKAGNVLMDSNGAVKLADFGVSACMFDAGDRQRSRNTFVGTPCWMAPEVMQQLHGYDFKADIWSFGITALEFAHGHAPFSKYPPMKVLLMTLQNAPPGLDYERDKRFSKSFKEMVAACLVKDPKKRPTSEKLLKHHFFKHARSNEYLARNVLDGLSLLGDRFRMLKARESNFLMQNKDQFENKEQLSQQEYIRGISAWNFNLEDLKNQAALIQDYGSLSTADPMAVEKQMDGFNDIFQVERQLSEGANHSNEVPFQEDELSDLQSECSLASFPVKPLQALKGYFDVCEDDENAKCPNLKEAAQLSSEQPFSSQLSPRAVDQDAAKYEDEFSRPTVSVPRHLKHEHKKFFSGSFLQDNIRSSKNHIVDGDRDHLQAKYQSDWNYSGPLLYRQKKDTNVLSVNEASEGALIQRKGRFKVTSAELYPKGGPNCTSSAAGEGVTSPNNSTLTAASVLLLLQGVLQQNAMQREEIIKIIKFVEQFSGKHLDSATEVGTSDSLEVLPSARERELQSRMFQLQQSIGSLLEELQRQKMKNGQLEKILNTLSDKSRKNDGK